MGLLTVSCDRCKNYVKGFESVVGTAGFYRTGDSPWSKYADPPERVICDECMWKDERYIKEYGDRINGTN